MRGGPPQARGKAKPLWLASHGRKNVHASASASASSTSNTPSTSGHSAHARRHVRDAMPRLLQLAAAATGKPPDAARRERFACCTFDFSTRKRASGTKQRRNIAATNGNIAE